VRRLTLWVVGIALALLVFCGGAWLWFKPTVAFDSSRTLYAYTGPGWNVSVNYRLGDQSTLVSLRMDGLSQHPTVEFQVVSSEPWTPQWQGRMEGQLSEYLTLNNGWSQSPQPMNRELAETLARSYKVILRLDGEARVIDFSQAKVGETVPWISIHR
jgi:hypothetical protein